MQTLLQQTEALYNHLETDFYEQLLKISEYKFAQPPKIIQVIYWTGAEDVAWVALIPPLRSLFDTLSALLTKVDPANPPNVEASPLPSPLWMERLSMARSDLQNSIAKKDGASLELALNRIKRALDIGPYEMGARLVMMVEDLLTNNLLAHMTNLNQKLMTTTTDPAVQTQFADLLVAMDRLKTSLSKAIVDYTEWNNIRRELRFIRYNLSPIQDRDDFKSAYHDVVETVRKLAGGSLDDWALSLVKLGDETLQDIEQIPANPANHLAAVQNQFNAYQSQVAEQHHKADEQLLAASHDLEQLEASLTALIRTLMPSA